MADLDTAALGDLLASSGSSYGALAAGSNPDTSGFNRYAPGGGSWWDRNFGDNAGANAWGSSGDYAKALGGLSKIGGGSDAGGGGGGSGAPQAPGGGPTGSPKSAIKLSDLVQILLQRQQALQNSAMGIGQGVGQPQPAARVTGLLGF